MTAREIGDILRETRVRKNMKMVTLAGLIDKGATQIFNTEKKPETVTLRNLILVAERLGLELVLQPKQDNGTH